MSRDIDQRVVQIEFDNKEFEKNIAVTQKSLNKLSESLNFDDEAESFDKLEKNSKKVKFTALQSAVTEVHNKFSLLENAAKRVVENIVDDAWYAAKQVVTSMSSINNFKTGWNLYEQITTSVQTLTTAMKEGNSEAEKFAIAQEKVNQASWFSDETNSDVKDMIKYMSMFLNKGFTSDEAMTTIMGISTLAASVGRAPAEASHAMYQLSQVGEYMNKQDWNSIKNLNMDTVDFKQAMLDAGVAAGKLVKVGDTYYKAGQKISDVAGEAFVNGKKVVASGESASSSLAITVDNFEQTLAKGAWATPEVLQIALDTYGEAANEIYKIYEELGEEVTTTEIMRTLEKEADEFLVEFVNTNEQFRSENGITETFESIKDISDEAQASAKELMTALGQLPLAYTDSFKYMQKAQEAKTLTEALDSVRTAIQKKWYQIFENIFGTYDTQRTLWTNISEQLWGIFVDPLESMLQVFKDADLANFGRDELDDNMSYVEGIIYNIIDIFGNLKSAITGAFQAIFPPKTKEDYQNLVVRIYELTEKLKDNQMLLKKVSSVVRGLIKIVVNPLKSISKIIKTIASSFTNVFKRVGKKITKDDLLGITKFERFADKLKISDEALQKIGDTATKIFSKVKEFWNMKISKKIGSISSLLSTATEKVRSFFGALKNGKKETTEDSGENGEETIFDKLKNGLENFKNKIIEVFDNIKKYIDENNVLENLALISFIGLMIAAIIAMIKVTLNFTTLAENLNLILFNVNRVVSNFASILGSIAFIGISIGLMNFALAAGMIALLVFTVVQNLEKLKKPKEIAGALASFGIVLGALLTMTITLGLLSKDISFGAIFGLSLLLLNVALTMVILSHIEVNTGTMIAFISSVVVIFGMMAILLKSLKLTNAASVLSIGALFIGLSIMLTTIASVYKKLLNVITTDPDKFYAIEEFLNQYMILASIMALIGGKVGNNALDGAVMLIALGASVEMVAKAMKTMSAIPAETLTEATSLLINVLWIFELVAVTIVLMEKLIPNKSMSSDFAGANAAAIMIGMSLSIIVLVGVFKKMHELISEDTKDNAMETVMALAFLMLGFAASVAIVSKYSSKFTNTTKAMSTVMAMSIFFGVVYLLIKSIIGIKDPNMYSYAISMIDNIALLMFSLALVIAATNISNVSGVLGIVVILGAVALLLYGMIKFSEMIEKAGSTEAFKALAPIVKDLIMYVGVFAALITIISAIKDIYKLIYPEKKEEKKEETKKEKDPFDAKKFWSIIGGVAALIAAAGALIYVSAKASEIVSKSNAWSSVLILFGGMLVFIAAVVLLLNKIIKTVEGKTRLVDINSRQILSLTALIGSIMLAMSLLVYSVSYGASLIKNNGATLQAVILFAGIALIFELLIRELISLTKAASKKSMTGTYMTNIINGMVTVLLALIAFVLSLSVAAAIVKGSGSLTELIVIVLAAIAMLASIGGAMYLLGKYVKNVSDIEQIADTISEIAVVIVAMSLVLALTAAVVKGTNSLGTFALVSLITIGLLAAIAAIIYIGAKYVKDADKLKDIAKALTIAVAALSVIAIVLAIVSEFVLKDQKSVLRFLEVAGILSVVLVVLVAGLVIAANKLHDSSKLYDIGLALIGIAAGLTAIVFIGGVIAWLIKKEDLLTEFIWIMGSMAAMFVIFAAAAAILAATNAGPTLQMLGLAILEASVGIAIGALGVGGAIALVIGSVAYLISAIRQMLELLIKIMESYDNLKQFGEDLSDALVDIAVGFSEKLGERAWEIGYAIGKVVGAIFVVVTNLLGSMLVGLLESIVTFLDDYWPIIKSNILRVIPKIISFVGDLFDIVFAGPFSESYQKWWITFKRDSLLDIEEFSYKFLLIFTYILDAVIAIFKSIGLAFEAAAKTIVSLVTHITDSIGTSFETLFKVVTGKMSFSEAASEIEKVSKDFEKEFKDISKEYDAKIVASWDFETNGTLTKPLTDQYEKDKKAFQQQYADDAMELYYEMQKRESKKNNNELSDSQYKSVSDQASNNLMSNIGSSMSSAFNKFFGLDPNTTPDFNGVNDTMESWADKIGGWLGGILGSKKSEDDTKKEAEDQGEGLVQSFIDGIKNYLSESDLTDEDGNINLNIKGVFDTESLKDTFGNLDLGDLTVGGYKVGDLLSGLSSGDLTNAIGTSLETTSETSPEVARAENGPNGTVNVYNTFNVVADDPEEFAAEVARIQEEQYEKYGRTYGQVIMMQ